jgi:hypothetical protein
MPHANPKLTKETILTLELFSEPMGWEHSNQVGLRLGSLKQRGVFSHVTFDVQEKFGLGFFPTFRLRREQQNPVWDLERVQSRIGLLRLPLELYSLKYPAYVSLWLTKYCD